VIDLADTRGVIVVVDDQWRDDGDAYTLTGASRPAPTDAPVVTALVPSTLSVTDPETDVLVQGSGFVLGDRVVFGGATPPTGYHDDTELAIRVSPKGWLPGVVDVGVGYSTRGPSNALPFTVT
jgi:hypothetical protein